ncbi:MAG: hypothetical protein HWN71_08810 [Desulfobacterales bacterium]|nr:hypothetical protein [Desulfobacterales bacterium]
MANNSERFTSHLLTLEKIVDESSITIRFIGRSNERNPSKFIYPILSDALDQSAHSNKDIILDFMDLEYMNSSTITPILKILDKVRCEEKYRVTIVYRQSLRWQDLSFSALKIFESRDNRIRITGR